MNKTLIIIILVISWFCNVSEAFELEQERMPIEKKSVVIVMQDSSGENFECEPLFIKNKQLLDSLLSLGSLEKANVYKVFLGLFSEMAEIIFSVEAGREPDIRRYKIFSGKLKKAREVLEKKHMPYFNAINNKRRFSRDVAGALMHVRNFIEQQYISTKYDKIYVVFISNMMQTLSKNQTMKYLKSKHIIFPDNVSILVFNKMYLCQDVSEVEKQIFTPELIAFWRSVIKAKEFKYFDSY